MDARYRANRANRCLLTAMAVLVGVVLIMAALAGPLFRFVRHNLWMNVPILLVLFAGVAMVFLHLLHLVREERLANLVHRRTFQEGRDGWDPPRLLERLPPSAVRERVAQVQELGARGGPAHEDALDEISIAEWRARTALIRSLPFALVALGLVGTFIGILLTVEGVQEILGSLEVDPYADMEVYLHQLRSDLAIPLRGMATAFSTSLFGLGGSVLLTFLAVQLSRAQDLFLAKMNDLTIIWLFPAFHVGQAAGRIPEGSFSSGAPSLAEASGRDLRALESGARYLEAGARALHEDVEGLREVVGRTEGFQRELLSALRELGEATTKGGAALGRLEASHRESAEETLRLLGEGVRQRQSLGRMEASVQGLEQILVSFSARMEELAGHLEEGDRGLRSSLQREAKTLGHQISSSLSDLASLDDAAAREICRRLSEGFESLEKAVREQGASASGGRGSAGGSARSTPKERGDLMRPPRGRREEPDEEAP